MKIKPSAPSLDTKIIATRVRIETVEVLRALADLRRLLERHVRKNVRTRKVFP